MSFAVVIPSRSIENLRACIAAVQEHEPDARIIVVDDGIDWGPSGLSFSIKWGVQDSVIPGEKPFVFSRNVNRGIQYAMGPRSPWLRGTEEYDSGFVVLNDDALLQYDPIVRARFERTGLLPGMAIGGFTKMERIAVEHPEYGIIGAVTNVTGQPHQLPRGVGLREVEHFAFVCVYIPRRTIERVGLLDERYCLPDSYGVEDRDYCMACERAGLKVGVFDHCYVDHGKLRSTFRGDPRAPRDFSKHLALFNEKWSLAV